MPVSNRDGEQMMENGVSWVGLCGHGARGGRRKGLSAVTFKSLSLERRFSMWHLSTQLCHLQPSHFWWPCGESSDTGLCAQGDELAGFQQRAGLWG